MHQLLGREPAKQGLPFGGQFAGRFEVTVGGEVIAEETIERAGDMTADRVDGLVLAPEAITGPALDQSHRRRIQLAADKLRVDGKIARHRGEFAGSSHGQRDINRRSIELLDSDDDSPGALRRLNTPRSGAGGAIQLTDALAAELAAGAGVHALRFAGERYDCGSKSGFLRATVAFGLARPDLGPDLARFLDGLRRPQTERAAR